MKRIIKITGITLASIILAIIIAIVIVFWFVFTPSKLTNIVKEQAKNFISCQTSLDEVELTVFETFPNIGLKIKNLQLINPIPNSPNDTLAVIGYCTVGLDIMELIEKSSIIVKQFHLKDGFANIFVDSLGNANYDILQLDTDTTSESTFKLDRVDLKKITIENLRASYTDIPSKIHAQTNGLNLNLEGKMQEENISANLQLSAGNTEFQLNDTVPMSASVNGLQLKYDGNIDSLNSINGLLQLALKDIYFSMGKDKYAEHLQLVLNSPLSVDINNQSFQSDNTDILINEYLINLKGNASHNSDNGDIKVDMTAKTNTWNIGKLLRLLPNIVTSKLPADIDFDGNLSLNATAKGVYNNSSIPVISADVHYSDGRVAVKDIPFKFTDINTRAHADIDMKTKSKLQVHSFSAKTGKNSVKASGTVDDLLDKMFCDVKLEAQLDIPELKPVIPAEIKAAGIVNANISAKFTLEQINKMYLEQIKATGTLDFNNLDVVYNDSMKVKSEQMQVYFAMPNPSKSKLSNELVHAEIESKDLNINMVSLLSADVKDVKLDIGVSNFLDTTKLLSVACDFDFRRLNATMDTISVSVNKPVGSVVVQPSERNKKNPTIKWSYQNDGISAQMGKDLSVQTQKIDISGRVSYNPKEEDIILQWNPDVKVDLQQGELNMASFPTTIYIPAVKFDFSSRKLDIKESKIKLGNSAFGLSGTVTNIGRYLKDRGILRGELFFVSEYADIYQLMDYINGLGSDSTNVGQDVESKEDNPFIVPLGVDITLNTKVKGALVGNTQLRDLHGQLTIKDGALVLEEMGFTSEAAKMQLTAIYRSPRKNHLFAGVDFHLLNIDIAKLISMFPEIDTIVPMLKTFAGKAEFHFAIETYMKSNYDIKYSTLLGSAAIHGEDLVLLDNETFNTISKKLLFKKKTKNKIDSLSVELTIFKNEIDLYPFLIAMDKYKAVISGRHNLDMTFDYHISVTETPLPIRLGVNIKGNLDKLKFKVVRCKYPKLFNPGKENAVDKKILELKNIIRSALKANVKQQDDE